MLDDANLRDPKKDSSNLAAECLKKALCLLEDMVELKSFRKKRGLPGSEVGPCQGTPSNLPIYIVSLILTYVILTLFCFVFFFFF